MVQWYGGSFESSATSQNHSFEMITGLTSGAVLCFASVIGQMNFPSVSLSGTPGGLLNGTQVWGITVPTTGTTPNGAALGGDDATYIHWNAPEDIGYPGAFWAGSGDGVFYGGYGFEWEWRGARRFNYSGDWWFEVGNFSGEATTCQMAYRFGFWDGTV